MIRKLRFAYALFFSGGLLFVTVPAQNKPATGKITNGQFALSYDGRGITVSNPLDRHGADLLAQGGRLGEPIVKYEVENRDWQDLSTRERKLEADPVHGSVVYTDSERDSPLKMVQRFRTDGTTLDWTIEIETTTNHPVRIGDLAIPIRGGFRQGKTPKRSLRRASPNTISFPALHHQTHNA